MSQGGGGEFDARATDREGERRRRRRRRRREWRVIDLPAAADETQLGGEGEILCRRSLRSPFRSPCRGDDDESANAFLHGTIQRPVTATPLAPLKISPYPAGWITNT